MAIKQKFYRTQSGQYVPFLAVVELVGTCRGLVYHIYPSSCTFAVVAEVAVELIGICKMLACRICPSSCAFAVVVEVENNMNIWGRGTSTNYK